MRAAARHWTVFSQAFFFFISFYASLGLVVAVVVVGGRVFMELKTYGRYCRRKRREERLEAYGDSIR